MSIRIVSKGRGVFLTEEGRGSPTPERMRHANDNFTIIDGATRMLDSPIDALHLTKRLSSNSITNDILREAADRYFEDFYQAGLAPLGAQDYGKMTVDGKTPKNDSPGRMAAVGRWNGATKAIGKKSTVVDRVVLRGIMPSDIELASLINALTDMAAFYKLMERQVARA